MAEAKSGWSVKRLVAVVLFAAVFLYLVGFGISDAISNSTKTLNWRVSATNKTYDILLREPLAPKFMCPAGTAWDRLGQNGENNYVCTDASNPFGWKCPSNWLRFESFAGLGTGCFPPLDQIERVG